MGPGAGRIRGQPIHQDFPSPARLLNPNEVIAMRENQIKREREDEDYKDGEENPG